MTVANRFQLPDDDARPAELWEVYHRLNSIQITVGQFERALTAYRASKGKLAVLEAFCEHEGLLPADLAAQAILLRETPIGLAAGDCVDLKTENARSYEAAVIGPIDPDHLGIHYLEEYDEDWSERENALWRLEVISGVRMTIDQVERGYRVYVGGCSDPFDTEFEEKRRNALWLFCQAEKLLPADAAVEAILLRYQTISDALANGVDIKTDDPALYASFATGPIDPVTIGIFAEPNPDDNVVLLFP